MVLTTLNPHKKYDSQYFGGTFGPHIFYKKTTITLMIKSQNQPLFCLQTNPNRVHDTAEESKKRQREVPKKEASKYEKKVTAHITANP